jgi:preprotein translocase SecE subunit
MARNRQRSKQRQAQRREARIASRDALGRDVTEEGPATRDALGSRLDDIGAPPENVGRSDTVDASPPPAPIVDGVLEGDELDDTGIDSQEFEAAEAQADALADDGGHRPRGHRGDGAPVGQPVKGSGIGRVGAFLSACWAELQRVQWPDRRQLTQLTGIVLFFVILAGAYLGALDALFSKLVTELLHL